MQGIITLKNFPPFTEHMWVLYLWSSISLPSSSNICTSSRGSRRIRFLRQGLQITGLSNPIFQTCMDNIRQIHARFAHCLPDGTLEEFVTSKFMHHDCIDTGNRYFTSRYEDPSSTAVPFSRAVDPHNFLSTLSDGNLFHGADNKVLYYRLSSAAHRDKLTKWVP